MYIFLNIMIFIIGCVFGSFFTLAVYRIPKGQDIIYTHSYCPNCKHKLSFLELIPVISYIALRGKCSHCGGKIRIRYFLLEILSGIVFLLFALSLKIDVYNINADLIIYFVLNLLYISSLFIIAGIDKEKVQIQKSLTLFGMVITSIYMIYVCILKSNLIYTYIIYLALTIVLLILDTVFLKKNLKTSYWVQILMLILYMLMFSGSVVVYITIVLTLLWIVIELLVKMIKERIKRKIIVKTKDYKEKLPIGFYLCVINILLILVNNFLCN